MTRTVPIVVIEYTNKDNARKKWFVWRPIAFEEDKYNGNYSGEKWKRHIPPYIEEDYTNLFIVLSCSIWFI